MADATVIERPRPHNAVPVATGKSTTSLKENKQGKVIPVEVPKLSDVPGYMDSLGWKVSAALMRKWFSSSAREMTLDEKLGRTPPSKYPSALVDTTTVKLDWILSFERAKAVYQSALSSSLFGTYGFDIPEARDQLARRIKRAGLFTTRVEVFGDLSSPPIWQHEHWQFRLFKIDTTQIDRGKIFLSGLDDLFGALASFGLYLSAVGTVTPDTEIVDTGSACKLVVKTYQIEITHIAVYARDTYDFIGAQYLGHWNKDGVEVVFNYILEEKIGTLNPSDYQPSGDPPDMKLPVGNWSFNEYRKKHNKGGDMLIFSDLKTIRLKRPLRYNITHQQVAKLS
ncbi:DUF6402 family protein [Pseudomonas congelans]|uniref:DUF6402 family protein n=1 Tax=Pseudomonas congelans TaxID=200452 RepID=UPI0013040083|nr:DUF6402 family protein [Pseudomonas congelans]